MPQVPYQPFPTVTPQSPGEQISVATPGAAFGENINSALREMGSTVEKAGDELFTRAKALQDLRNEADAREAQSDYATQASLLHADFSAKEGKDAVDALPGYLQAQRDLRTSIRGGLKTPMAQRYYDADSLPFMQRNIFSAAGHAADQNKRYIVGTAQAGADLTARTFTNPDNDAELDLKIAGLKQYGQTLRDAQGWSDDQYNDWLFKQTSNTYFGQIVQLAQNNPQAAIAKLQAAKDKGVLTSDNYTKALEMVYSRNRAIGSNVIANQVYSPDKTYPQMEKEATDLAKKNSYGDPLMEKDTLAALRAKAANTRYETNLDKNTNTNTIYDGIVGGVKNMQELLAKPGMQAAYDALPPKDQAKVPGWINEYNIKRDKVVDEQTYTQLRGLANNDVESFLNTDYMHMPGLSQQHIRQLNDLRQKLILNPRDDPRTLRAISWMRGSHATELQALGLMRRDGNSPDEYDHYTGALEGAIEAWQQTNGKPPSYKDITDTIGPALIKQVSQPGTIFGSYWPNQTPFFDVLQQHVEDAKAEAAKRGIEPPTDNEIRRAYLAQMYQQLFGGSGGGRPKPAAGPNAQ